MTANELRIASLSTHFKYHELFPKYMCEEMSALYLEQLIDPRILDILEEVRSDLGTVYVNNWFWGGKMQYRGFRYPGSPFYSPGSAHSFGQAVDFNVKNMDVVAVHAHLLKYEDKYMSLGLTRLESPVDAPTWIHADVKFTGDDHIKIFRA